MLGVRKLLCLVSILFINGCQSIEAVAGDSKSFVVTNVNVVDVTSRQIHTKQHVCVEKGVIKQVSNKACNNDGVSVIDGNDGYLTPGLIDMHVHMFEKQGLAFTLSHGVTHVRLMNGVSDQLKWRDKVNAGELLGSSATVSSPINSGYKDAIVHHGVTTAKAARQAVRKYNDKGYDLIKVYGNLDSTTFKALIDESKLVGILVAKHGPDVPKPLTILNHQHMQSFEHVEDIFYSTLDRQFSIKELASFIASAQQINVPITPTLNIYDQLTRLSVEKEQFLKQIPEHYISTIVKLEDKKNQIKRWLNASVEKAKYNEQVLAFLLKITKQLHDADIPLLIGSDSGNLMSPHGLATHNEMALFYKAGIDSFSILRAATVNAANALGHSKKLGQIKPGFDADFIYTTNNPIDDLKHLAQPDAVSKRGQWLTKTDLEQLRDNAVETRSLWSELKVYSEMITR